MGLATAEGDAQWPMSHYDKGNTNSCPYDAAGTMGSTSGPRNFGERISKPAIGSDGALYVTSSGGGLIALSSDGDEKWRFLGPSDVIRLFPRTASRQPSRGWLHLLCDRFATLHFQAPTAVFMRSGPTERCDGPNHLDAPVLTAPRIDGQGNVLIVAAQWGNASYLGFSELRCYDKGGGIAWTFSPPSANGSIFSEPASSSNGTVYLTTFLNNNTTLWAIDPDGDELWNRSFPFLDIESEQWSFFRP